ncbi:LysR substrate-binding domain-containing protein [Phenylobacterium sp.]|uniref:LysR family transcriptional regulator n=1 Tax=Phenylobacterium sp. TaxID=1871053 RepID=UPI002896F609|nr:LysR substrate-binding domain-containing protein [Phenylobacterium sp.]
MTLTHLSNFIRIAELQSLSKAAAVIRIAQPALSRQIRQLEAELRAPLLIRHAWGVSLTPAGEVLLDHARRIVRDMEGLRDAVHAVATELRGRVALGVPVSIAGALLPPLATALSQRHPGLRLHMIDGFSAGLHALTISGELDLAVLYDDRAMGPVLTAPLLTENLVLVTHPDVRVEGSTTAEMLAGRTLILPARPNRLRLIVDEVLAELDPSSLRIIEFDSLSALTGLVVRGTGCTVLPYSAVAEHVARKDLAVWPLSRPQLSRTLLLARPLQKQRTAAIAAVESELGRLVGELAEPMRWLPIAARAD